MIQPIDFAGAICESQTTASHSIGLWLSLVERLVRDEEAVGSNPTSPTRFLGSEGVGGVLHLPAFSRLSIDRLRETINLKFYNVRPFGSKARATSRLLRGHFDQPTKPALRPPHQQDV